MKFAAFLCRVPWLLVLALLGQLSDVVKVVENLTPILSILVTIIVLIALPILVFHILTKEVLSKL